MTKAVLDHVGIWCRDVAAAADGIARAWRVHSVVGGRHEGDGTCNRLIGGYGQTYVELIGPDPMQSTQGTIAQRGAMLDDRSPCLAAFRHADLESAAIAGAAAGLRTRGPRRMSRVTQTGAILEWRVLFFEDDANPFFPFLIDWGDSLHPSASLQPAVAIADLAWPCPDPEDCNRKLRSIGIAALAVAAARPSLHFTLETPAGPMLMGA